MAVDLPPGQWSALLVGAWWTAPPDALTVAVAYWRQQADIKRHEVTELRNQRSRLSANKGRTAEDLLERYWQGEQQLETIAHQCDIKSCQNDRVADAINNLRDRLGEVAHSGNEEIDKILAGPGPMESKVAAVNAVIARANADAAHAGTNAMSNIVDATQRVLDGTIGGDARSWLQQHGVSLDKPPPAQPVTADDLKSQPAAYGSERLSAAASAKDPLALMSLTPTAFGRDLPAPGISAPNSSPPQMTAFGNQLAAPSAPLSPSIVPTTLTPSAPTPGVGTPSLPVSPSSAGSGSLLSPQSLGQSFTAGMATGAPAGASAESVSAGAMQAASEPMAPATPPPAAPAIPPPTVPTAGASGPPVLDHGGTASGHAPTASPGFENSSGMTTVAPVVAGGPAAGAVTPLAGGTPPGPLPAYGSDLRPPVVAPPAAPPTPSGPVSGAAVAASPTSSPAAGGSLLSPVGKTAAHPAGPGQAVGGSYPVAGPVAAATAGAVAGDSSTRAADQERLRRIVNAVARQEPGLSWAAGLRDDRRNTLLVTDLAGGWIPPHVQLPAHVLLLEPADRNRDASAVELLGAVSESAAHHPHGYITEAGADAVKLTGDRTARTLPTIDELGPTLVEAVRRRDGLPRVAQAVAVAAARNYGVPDNEAELLRERATEIRRSVLTAYPHHDRANVADWMLLAAIMGLIEDSPTTANYHLAWASAATSTRRCR
ncbi:DUF5631 domain-containing protein [Mycobacterium sp.]|uniref:DUF5631 domain-containing protein n=1 Tax=Mycobacterium sp. TaxID=1785 RepID=UPI003BA8CE55